MESQPSASTESFDLDAFLSESHEVDSITTLSPKTPTEPVNFESERDKTFCRVPNCGLKATSRLEACEHEKGHFHEKMLYYCAYECCSFHTKRWSDLLRHCQAKHCLNPPKFPCPVVGCKYSGDNGFRRKDKFNDHYRNVHEKLEPMKLAGFQYRSSSTSIINQQSVSQHIASGDIPTVAPEDNITARSPGAIDRDHKSSLDRVLRLQENKDRSLEKSQALLSDEREGGVHSYSAKDEYNAELKSQPAEETYERMEISSNGSDSDETPFNWNDSDERSSDSSASDNDSFAQPNCDQGDKEQSAVGSGYHTASHIERDAIVLASSVGLPIRTRNEFLAEFSSLLHEHSTKGTEAEMQALPTEYIQQALSHLLNDYAVSLKAVAETGLQYEAVLLIGRFRNQIAQLFTETCSMHIQSVQLHLRQHGNTKAPPSEMVQDLDAIILSHDGVEDADTDMEELGSDWEDPENMNVEFSAVKSFLVSTAAFQRLQADVREELCYTTVMQTIKRQIVNHLVSQTGISEATFHISWELRQCLCDQYEDSNSLSEILVVAGTTRQAYAATCMDYMCKTWSRTGATTLAVLELALKGQKLENSGVLSPIKSIRLPSESQEALKTSAIFVLKGSQDDVVEVAQQLCFLAASFRLPRPGLLCQSDVILNCANSSGFKLEMFELEPIPECDYSCWHPLFPGTVIARGFPIPARSGQIGIELPYTLMTSLARILHPVDFDGGILLKGFSTMLVPTSLTTDSIQWHFISNQGNQRLPVASVQKLDLQWSRVNDFDELCQRRAILGYCPRVKVHLGTREAECDSIDYGTYTKRIGRKMDISGVAATLTSSACGIPGPLYAHNKRALLVSTIKLRVTKGLLPWSERAV